jgi:S-ribosylhomocysteine lyase
MLRDYDHRTVHAPYLALVERRHSGTCSWHLRVLQPNIERLPVEAVHSLEHALAYRLRTADERFVGAGPMGCGTGYYLTTSDLADFATTADLLADALTWISEAKTVPGADPIRCGNAADHDPEAMRKLAGYLLDHRDEWGSPGPDAQLISADIPMSDDAAAPQEEPWLVQGPPMAWWNRRSAAKRENWPDGALTACQDIEHRNPDWSPTYEPKGVGDGPPGFYAARHGTAAAGRPKFGATPDELEAAITSRPGTPLYPW